MKTNLSVRSIKDKSYKDKTICDNLYKAGMRNRKYMRHIFNNYTIYPYDTKIIIYPPFIRRLFYRKMKRKKKIFPSIGIRGCFLSIYGKALESNKYIQLSNKDMSTKKGILQRSEL